MEKSGHFSSDSRASRLKVDPEGLSPRTSRSLRLRAEKGLRQRSPAFELREEAAAVREMFATAAGERRGELGAQQGIQSDSRVPSLCRQVLSCRPGVYPVTDISRLRRCNLQDRLTVAELAGRAPVLTPQLGPGPHSVLFPAPSIPDAPLPWPALPRVWVACSGEGPGLCLRAVRALAASCFSGPCGLSHPSTVIARRGSTKGYPREPPSSRRLFPCPCYVAAAPALQDKQS